MKSMEVDVEVDGGSTSIDSTLVRSRSRSIPVHYSWRENGNFKLPFHLILYNYFVAFISVYCYVCVVL